MTNGLWTADEEVGLANYLVRSVIDRATGRAEDECAGNYPRDVYFIGNLRPAADDDNTLMARVGGELLGKLSPVAFGAEFLLRPAGDQLDILVNLRWACYYRVFPTYEQQLHHQQRASAQADTAPQETEEEAGEPENAPDPDDDTIAQTDVPPATPPPSRRRRVPRDSLFIVFRKIPCQAHGTITLRLGPNGRWECDPTDLQEAVTRETLRAQQTALADPSAIRAQTDPDGRIRVPETALASPSAYDAFCISYRIPIVPTWLWSILADVQATPMQTGTSGLLLNVTFTNASPMSDRAPNTEAYLFDPIATFRFADCTVLPFELELAPRGFRYDRWMWGRAFNCALERLTGHEFATTATPRYEQLRYRTRTQPEAGFSELATNPLPVLEWLLAAMQDYRREWLRQGANYAAQIPDWQERHYQEYDRDRRLFEEEIVRFEQGLNLLRTDADIRLAFRLTNETFHRGPRVAWRLFQIVFLVSQIPGITALRDSAAAGNQERRAVDIIYFPTGGGKTEAYLGVIVFHLFFDRLRGKPAGVSVWNRFPLRLLTLQQTQRVADIIGIAELVRREQSDTRLSGPGVDGFAVGYFVGEEATPNKLEPPRRGEPPDADWSTARDANARQRWKKLFRCPSCRTLSVVLDFDEAAVRLPHRCTEAGCRFPGGLLPIYIVDNEIYRYLPTVVVGTIDKLAALGNQRKLSMVLGRVDGRCSRHGYYLGRCCQKGCDNTRLNIGAPPGLSGPTLFVQDELHLLKEGLGTFDAHYETFTQRLLSTFGQTSPLKLIASSATIEAFERQVQHLYGRRPDDARRFPGQGPTLRESFYAETLDHPQRLFVGVIPHNKTIFNAVLEIIQYYHEALQRLTALPAGSPNPYGGSLEPGTAIWRALLDFYTTSLTYFSNTRHLSEIKTDLESHVNSELESRGYRRLFMAELTGDTPSDEVTRVLGRLETLGGTLERNDAVLATSMISHGVDVDRLNTMIFYTMPRQNAEYIQASSRIGRIRVGVVLTCFHPARERDQSHYAYFTKFHEFLGQLVEPVAINRWSKFSVRRTLPGLFMGVLLQLIAHRPGGGNPGRFYALDHVKQAISRGTIRAEDFIPVLEAAYGGSADGAPGLAAFRDEIQLRVRQFLDQILAAGPQQPWVSGALVPPPMTSLREVDEQLEVELDSNGTAWAARRGAQ